VAGTPDPALVAAPWRRAAASQRLLDALEAGGRPARFVGGCVRDSLKGLERAAWDVDLCTPEPPERVLTLLERAGVKAIPTGLDHGTVTAVVDGQPFEITTLRRDVETDGRHAVVAFTADFRADAARRDFTINAMSCDRAGRLFDYFDGRADLAAGVLRFVGEPGRRIAEDYLRVLRFFRFYARFGTRAPDAATAAALRAGVAGLERLSGERVAAELEKLLDAPDPRAAVAWMDELGVLAWTLGGAPDRTLFDRLVAVEPAAEPWRRLAALVRGADGAGARALAARLRLSKVDAARLERLVGVAAERLDRADAAALARTLYREGREGALAAGLFALARDGTDGDAAARLEARIAAAPVPTFPLKGADVVAAGVAPGAAVGRVLKRAEAEWLASGCAADGAALRARLPALVAAELGDGEP
jgi:poly(A) polymerase/tRNA nucleotidyltransferase (CCA-adding enzyme)